MTEVVNTKTSPEHLKDSKFPLTQPVSEDTLDVLYEIPELARQELYHCLILQKQLFLQ